MIPPPYRRRHGYLSKGKALLKEGKTSEARDCFQRCIDVSPEMALAFIKLLRGKGIQAIVAPYEADAQLAYLVKEGLADFVITEDSDLLAFGASRVNLPLIYNTYLTCVCVCMSQCTCIYAHVWAL